MKTKNTPTIIALAAIVLTAATAKANHAFVIIKDGTDLKIEKIEVALGETKTIHCGLETGNIDVIFPVGVGGSGSVARTADPSIIILQNTDGALTVTSRGETGKEWKRPARTMDDLHSQDIRLSVTGQDGQQKAFLIAGYETVHDEPVGPVIDMFAGRIPLQTGDYVLCTDTFRPLKEPRVYGRVPFEHEDHIFVKAKLPTGVTANFILDVGAGQSVISREFLPKGTKIDKSGRMQYSAAGKEMLKYEVGGATGVSTPLGIAALDEFKLGSMTFKDKTFAVLSKFPDMFDRPVAGIVGLDLLRHAEIFTLEFASETAGRLVLSKTPRKKTDNVTQIPTTTINSHLGVRGNVNGVSTAFIVDTGSPDVFLDDIAAKAAGVKAIPNSGKDAHGLDEGTIRATRATINELQLGDAIFKSQRASIGALPVFAPLHVHDQSVALLGNTVFSQCAWIEFDLKNRVANFKKK